MRVSGLGHTTIFVAGVAQVELDPDDASVDETETELAGAELAGTEIFDVDETGAALLAGAELTGTELALEEDAGADVALLGTDVVACG